MEFGLVGAGNVAGSFVARLPGLDRYLGPVAAHSFRVASRTVNGLKAGRAVRHFSDLAEAAQILVVVPAARLPHALSELSGSLDWSGKKVVLCGEADSTQLSPLKAAGASVASLHPVPGSGVSRFTAEGDRPALRVARRLVALFSGKLEIVETRQFGAYLAALSFSSSLFVPLIDYCGVCLRAAGIREPAAHSIAQGLFMESLRAYRHAGRRSWRGPLAQGDAARIQRELATLLEMDPYLAAYYREASALALGQFRRHPVLREELRRPIGRAQAG